MAKCLAVDVRGTSRGLASRVLVDALPVWVVAALAAGIAWPALAALAPLVLPALVLMVGSISLTVDGRAMRGLPWGRVALVVGAGALLPAAAWGVGRLAGLAPALVLGLVMLAAAPPELTTPVLTRVAGGGTAASAALLLTGGAGALVVVPVAAWAVAGAGVPLTPLVVSLAVGVVLPMGVAVLLRTRWPGAVGRGDALTRWCRPPCSSS